MPQNIITAGNATSAFSQAAGDDGTLKIVVGPNGSQVDALAFSATGVPTFAAGGLKLATAIATTSGTSHDFTGIPSWVKRITVMFNGVSWSTTGPYLRIQIGAGSVDATGYVGAQTLINGAGSGSWQTTFSAGFDVSSLSAVADTVQGQIVLTNMGSNIWAIGGLLVRLGASVQSLMQFTGTKTLSGALDRVRITTSNGTDTFDAGSVNILYEG